MAATHACSARYGRVDVLVNNAGSIVQGKIHEVSIADWKSLMSTDLDGVFYCTHFFMPALLNSKGNVVNTSSVSGLGGDWGMSVYNAAKGAVTNLPVRWRWIMARTACALTPFARALPSPISPKR